MLPFPQFELFSSVTCVQLGLIWILRNCSCQFPWCALILNHVLKQRFAGSWSLLFGHTSEYLTKASDIFVCQKRYKARIASLYIPARIRMGTMFWTLFHHQSEAMTDQFLNSPWEGHAFTCRKVGDILHSLPAGTAIVSTLNNETQYINFQLRTSSKGQPVLLLMESRTRKWSLCHWQREFTQQNP
jgi:hypothetical protein